ncbi:MAG: hypothetical protein VX764_07780 [Planctomycetota bacterium]|nr:hypothetical protein [Planctomycetota bacterium]
MKKMLLIPLALLLLLLTGCEIKIDRRDLLLRYDARSDTLECIGINEGICASKKGDIPKARQAIIECLNGQRTIQLGCFTEIPFDRDDFSACPEVMWANQQVVLDSVKIYLDDEERLSGVQRFHVRQFSQVLAVLNRTLHRNVLEELSHRDLDETRGEGDLDESSIKLMLDSAARNIPWFRLEGDELVAEIPMSREYWDTFRKKLLCATLGNNEASFSSLAQIYLQLSDVQWQNDALHLRLGGLINGTVVVESVANLEYDDGLLHALEESGYSPDPDVTASSVRNWLQPEEF